MNRDGQSLGDLRGFSGSLVVLQLPVAQGFDLVKGFVSRQWEQAGGKEGRSEGGEDGRANGGMGMMVMMMTAVMIMMYDAVLMVVAVLTGITMKIIPMTKDTMIMMLMVIQHMVEDMGGNNACSFHNDEN